MRTFNNHVSFTRYRSTQYGDNYRTSSLLQLEGLSLSRDDSLFHRRPVNLKDRGGNAK